MGAKGAVHPPDETLRSYGLGKLDAVSSMSVSRHIEGCDSCQRRVAELSSDDFLVRLRNADAKAGVSAPAWSKSGAPFSGQDQIPVAPPAADTLPPELVEHPDYQIVLELG
jgi:hypothetical protein